MSATERKIKAHDARRNSCRDISACDAAVLVCDARPPVLPDASTANRKGRLMIITLLVGLFLWCVCVWAAKTLMRAFSIGEPVYTVVHVVLAVLFILWLLGVLGLWGGFSTLVR
jgi:hypothetical protein